MAGMWGGCWAVHLAVGMVAQRADSTDSRQAALKAGPRVGCSELCWVGHWVGWTAVHWAVDLVGWWVVLKADWTVDLLEMSWAGRWADSSDAHLADQLVGSKAGDLAEPMEMSLAARRVVRLVVVLAV